MALQPQAALETAVLSTIRGIGDGSRYSTDNSGRTLNAQPPPRCGKVWVSVWHDLSRQARSRMALHETFGCHVTITARMEVQPWDRLVLIRDDLERRGNQIRAAVHIDCLNNRIQREASSLMAADGTGQKVGFREVLEFQGFQGLQEVGPQWFMADLDHPTAADAGLALTLRFDGLLLIQALATME